MRTLLFAGSLSALLIGGAAGAVVLEAGPVASTKAVETSAPTGTAPTTTGTGTTVQSGNATVSAGSDNLSVQSTDSNGNASVKVTPQSVAVQVTDANGTSTITIDGSTVSITSPEGSVSAGPNGVSVTGGGQSIKVPTTGMPSGLSLGTGITTTIPTMSGSNS